MLTIKIMIANQLLDIVKQIWQEGEAVQDFRDVSIVHLYKN